VARLQEKDVLITFFDSKNKKQKILTNTRILDGTLLLMIEAIKTFLLFNKKKIKMKNVCGYKAFCQIIKQKRNYLIKVIIHKHL